LLAIYTSNLIDGVCMFLHNMCGHDHCLGVHTLARLHCLQARKLKESLLSSHCNKDNLDSVLSSSRKSKEGSEVRSWLHANCPGSRCGSKVQLKGVVPSDSAAMLPAVKYSHCSLLL
jgi:hypothetical protein